MLAPRLDRSRHAEIACRAALPSMRHSARIDRRRHGSTDHPAAIRTETSHARVLPAVPGHPAVRRRRAFVAHAFATLCVATSAQGPASARAPEAPASANMRLLGHADLQGRGAFHGVVARQGKRWIAYVGHMGGEAINALTGRSEPNGTSLLDVTDPARPKYLAHIAGEPGHDESGGARTVRVCAGAQLRKGAKSAAYLLRPYGGSAFEVWDVADPAAPRRVSTVARNLQGAGRSWWECDTGYAYLVVGDGAWRASRILRIYDLSDPANPVFVRAFGLPGQEPGSIAAIPFPLLTVRSTGTGGNRVYLGYGQRQGGVLQILDRQKLLQGPKDETAESLLYPQLSRHELPANATANMVVPLIGMEISEFARQSEGRRRDFIAVTGRSVYKECLEARQMVWFVDVTAEYRPYGVSSWTVREQSGDFCSRGGRFGAQSANENLAPVFAGRIAFIAHMNAGVRALDVRNPFHPQEIAHFIPPLRRNTVVLDTPPQLGRPAYSDAAGRRAVQTTHVEVDDRGYIYALDRANTGMEILELTGSARRMANWGAAVK
jgi:hypothetical protein